MTIRPIHKLVLVIPVEEQTMEEPEDVVGGKEEEVHTQEDWNSNEAEEKQEREESVIEGPPLESSAPEEAGIGRRNQGRSLREKRGSGGAGGG